MDTKELLSLIERRKNIHFTFPVDYNDRILVLAPHPDDETLGCGGIISYFKSINIKVHVVLFTNGEKGGRQKNIADIRRAEFIEACNIIGVDYMYFLNYVDGELSTKKECLEAEIEKMVSHIQPHFIFSPYILDASNDHSIVTEVTKKVVKNKISLFMYEVWTPILYPDFYIDITHFYSNKNEAIRCYKSQEKIYQLSAKAEAISRMRSVLSMHRHSIYMECFRQY